MEEPPAGCLKRAILGGWPCPNISVPCQQYIPFVSWKYGFLIRSAIH